MIKWLNVVCFLYILNLIYLTFWISYLALTCSSWIHDYTASSPSVWDEDTKWRKVKQIWDEDTQWRKVKQMQSMWLCIFTGKQFEALRPYGHLMNQVRYGYRAAVKSARWWPSSRPGNLLTDAPPPTLADLDVDPQPLVPCASQTFKI